MATARLPDDTLAEWVKMRETFDEDPAKPNPYEEPESCELSTLPVFYLLCPNCRSRHDGLSEMSA